MPNPELIDDALATLRAVLPPNLSHDIEKNLRATLLSIFERLDLVTREEFEVQQSVLERTRSKLEQLEKLVAQLEAKRPKK